LFSKFFLRKSKPITYSSAGCVINIKEYKAKDDAQVKTFYDDDVDFISNYNQEHGNLVITLRKLLNNDFFLYFEYEGKDSFITLEFGKIVQELQFDHMYRKPPFSSRYGENKLTGIGAYLDLADGSAVISKVYRYKKLSKTYGDIEKSTLYELINETGVQINSDNNIEIAVGGSGRVTFFVLMSYEKLFKNQKNLTKYMEHYYEALYNNSVWNTFFVTPEGSYSKLPYSIEPFTKEGYGYSLHHSSRKDLISFYRKTKERFYENFIVNAIFQAYLYQPIEQGMFQSVYTSTWLKKDTGIVAPYIDTRLNEHFILMLQDFQKIIKSFSTLDPMKEYVDFFCKKYNDKNQVYQCGEGVFFPDYFKGGLGTPTHTSLNHQLGISQMLLKAWMQYNDERYFAVAAAIFDFIKETCTNWKKDSNDLYYGVKYDAKGCLEFFGDDYIFVTLLDLLLTQKSLMDKGKPRNETLDTLTDAKLSYLKNTEYDIFSSNPAFASGERIDSAALALKLYKQINSAKRSL